MFSVTSNTSPQFEGIVEQCGSCPWDSSSHTASADPRFLLPQFNSLIFPGWKLRLVRSDDLGKSHSYLFSSHRTEVWVFNRQYCVCPPGRLQNISPGCWTEGGRGFPPSPFLYCVPSGKDFAPDSFSKYLVVTPFAIKQCLLSQPNQRKPWRSLLLILYMFAL